MVKFCEHGYGGFFVCPKGCHSKGPIQDQNDLDRDIDYFFNRLEDHGMADTSGAYLDTIKKRLDDDKYTV